MAYTVLSKSDAARGKKYHLIEISTNRSVEFKLDDGVTEEEITTIVDQFLEEETRQKEILFHGQVLVVLVDIEYINNKVGYMDFLVKQLQQHLQTITFHLIFLKLHQYMKMIFKVQETIPVLCHILNNVECLPVQIMHRKIYG